MAGSSSCGGRVASRNRPAAALRSRISVLLALAALATPEGAAAAGVARRSSAVVRALAAPGAGAGSVVTAADTIPDASLTPLQRIAKAEDRRVLHGGVLAAALRDADPALRRRAALAVGRLQDTTGVALLLPLLSDTDLETRREALFALGQIGLARPARPEAGPGAPAPARAAIERALAGADAVTADLAIEALGKLGERGATALVASYLGNGEPRLRAGAAVALWRLADSTALEPLLARSDDSDPEVRWRVLYALEKIVDPDRVVLYAALHVDDDDWRVRACAVRTLGRQKSAQATAYVQQKLEDPEVGVVVNAIRALQLIADTTCGTCAAGLTRSLGAPHPYVRATAALALADRFAWASADSVERRAALDSLAVHLGDEDAAMRAASARALLAHRGEQALPLVEHLLSDSSAYARAGVLDALTLLPAAAAGPLLAPECAPGRPLIVRMTALEAAGRLKLREAAPRLRGMLSDTSALVVAAAAGALADLADSASVPALARAYAEQAGDPDADARTSLRDALRTLAGRPFADSVERMHPARVARAVYDAAFFAAPTARGAILHTGKGDIEWAFYGEEAPQTVKNFVRLAERGYFDGLAVHRVVPNFVIQDGDPTGTGSGGPGWTIRCEYNRLRYEPGMVGMALSGKDTGGSQWFITHSPQPHLNGRYTIFARVARGMDVVHRIEQGDRVLKVEILR